MIGSVAEHLASGVVAKDELPVLDLTTSLAIALSLNSIAVSLQQLTRVAAA